MEAELRLIEKYGTPFECRARKVSVDVRWRNCGRKMEIVSLECAAWYSSSAIYRHMIILPLPEHHRRTSGRIELTPRVVLIFQYSLLTIYNTFILEPLGLPVFQPSPNPCFPILAAARKSPAESDSAECSTEFQYECIGVLSQTYQYWNSVLQSAESDSAVQVPAAASIGKQGFGDV